MVAVYRVTVRLQKISEVQVTVFLPSDGPSEYINLKPIYMHNTVEWKCIHSLFHTVVSQTNKHDVYIHKQRERAYTALAWRDDFQTLQRLLSLHAKKLDRSYLKNTTDILTYSTLYALTVTWVSLWSNTIAKLDPLSVPTGLSSQQDCCSRSKISHAPLSALY